MLKVKKDIFLFQILNLKCILKAFFHFMKTKIKYFVFEQAERKLNISLQRLTQTITSYIFFFTFRVQLYA